MTGERDAREVALRNVLRHASRLTRRARSGARVNDDDLANFVRFCKASGIEPTFLREIEGVFMEGKDPSDG